MCADEHRGFMGSFMGSFKVFWAFCLIMSINLFFCPPRRPICYREFSPLLFFSFRKKVLKPSPMTQNAI